MKLRVLAPPVLMGLVVAVVVALHISPDIPMDSDEANHANLALRQYQDLRDGHFTDFLRHSYRTGQFPFLHGWTVVPWLALLGPTLYAARIAQVLLFVVGCGAAAWAGWRAADDDPRAGWIAGALFALSPALAGYSGLVMLETPGAATTAVALAVFAEACRAEGRRALLLHAATAAAVLAVYFTKLNYGLWIAPAIAAGHALRVLRPERRRRAVAEAATYLGVLLVVAVLWYSTEAQRDAFRGFLLHNPSQAVSVERDAPEFRVPGISLGNLTAYPGLVASEYHLHAVVGALAALAFLWGARPSRLLRSPLRVACVACVLWTWLVLSMGFREYAMARFIAPALAPFWIVAGAGAADALRGVRTSKAFLAAALVLAAGGVAVQAATVPERLRREYEVDAQFAPVFAFLRDALPPRASVLVVNYTDHVSARHLEWVLATRNGTAWRESNVVGFNAERIYESAKRFDDWMDRPRRWGDPTWASYVVEFTPGPAFHDAVAHEDQPPIVLPETLALWRDAIARRGERLERVAERRWDDLDVTVTVWRDRSPPPHLGLRGGD